MTGIFSCFWRVTPRTYDLAELRCRNCQRYNVNLGTQNTLDLYVDKNSALPDNKG